MRKLVAAAICLLSLSLIVTTGRCIKEARSRRGKKCCEQQLRRVDKALSRAGDMQIKSNQIKFISLFFCLVFLHLLNNKNKLREYWLPRITDKLIMIGSQFIHMFTTSLGRHTR